MKLERSPPALDGPPVDDRKPKSPRISFRDRLILIGIVAACWGLLIYDWFLDNSTEIMPDHSGIVVGGALGVGAFVALVTLAATLWFKPSLRWPLPIAAPVLALCFGVMAIIWSMIAIDRAEQFADFHFGKTIQGERYFPIHRAYVGDGKGVSYHIQLADHFADLDISKQDYQVMGKIGEDLYPEGFCLRAIAQQNGEALRIMHSSSKAFPTGSVVPCEKQ